MPRILQDRDLERYELAHALLDRGNHQRAFRMFLALAREGYGEAQNELGNMYDSGQGMRRSRGKALHWYAVAAANGNTAALLNGGALLRERGRSKRALAWYARAIDAGRAEGHIESAKMWIEDLGDPARALAHLRLASSSVVSEAETDDAAALAQLAEGLLEGRQRA